MAWSYQTNLNDLLNVPADFHSVHEILVQVFFHFNFILNLLRANILKNPQDCLSTSQSPNGHVSLDLARSVQYLVAQERRNLVSGQVRLPVVFYPREFCLYRGANIFGGMKNSRG